MDAQKLPSRSNKSYGSFEFADINLFYIHDARQVHENPKIHLLHTIKKIRMISLNVAFQVKAH